MRRRRPYGETMRRRIVCAVAALIAVLAGCQESTTIPPEFENDAEAVRWYRLAAEQGHAAQVNLGGMYELGWGVLEDDVLAHMWFNIAGVNGHEDAREDRDNLERDMTLAEINRATELARECMDSDYQNCAP